MAIQIGDIVGDYEVTGVLGRGGMGRVFRVRNRITEREEAMKIVLSDFDNSPAYAERFLREIKIHASLQHPHIATVHTALRVGERLVMMLELVDGVSLEEKLQRGSLPVAEATGHIRDVLSALAYAHERGVVHRDIKPANILFTAAGLVKLTDFGMAISPDAIRFTAAGRAVGTLAYMSPEQVNAAEVDARSDIYSLSLTLYEMVTGRRAVQGDTQQALLAAQLVVMPPDPRAINPSVPGHISAAIMRGLAKDPQERFQTALEFQAALRETGEALPPVSGIRAAAPPASELADLEQQLSRAIGPIAHRLVADAARRFGTISGIRGFLASQIDDAKARDKFLKPNLSPTVTMVAATGSGAPLWIDPAAADHLTQALAPFVGPIAKVLVSRGAKATQSVAELKEKLAAEIPSPDDRKRFLASVRSIS